MVMASIFFITLLQLGLCELCISVTPSVLMNISFLILELQDEAVKRLFVHILDTFLQKETAIMVAVSRRRDGGNCVQALVIEVNPVIPPCRLASLLVDDKPRCIRWKCLQQTEPARCRLLRQASIDC